jgi:multiple sugar transport system substrate-binding protein
MKTRSFSRREFLKSASLTGLGLALAACAPQATQAPAAPTAAPQATVVPQAAATQPPAATATTAPQPTVAPPAAAPVKISVWGWWADRMKLFQNAGDKFTAKLPNITVEVTSIDKDLWTKVYASVPAGTGPTLQKMQTTNYFKMLDQGLLIKLDEMTFPVDWLKSKFPTHAWDSYEYYVMPEGIQGAIFMYNKAMFTAAGLDPAAPPKSWDEYVAAAKKLTKKDASGKLTLEGISVDDWLPELNLLYQQGGNLVKRDGNTITANFNTPEMETAWTFFYDAFKKDMIWDPNFPYFTDAIGTAKAAMCINESWGWGSVQSTYPDVFKDLAATAPPLPGGQLKQYYGRKNSVLGLASVVNRPAEETDAGRKFLEFLYKEDLDDQLAISTISGLVPTHADNVVRKEVTDDPFLGLAAQLTAKEFDTVDIPDSFSKIFYDGMTMLTANGNTVKEVMEFGQTELQKVIDGGELKRIQ